MLAELFSGRALRPVDYGDEAEEYETEPVAAVELPRHAAVTFTADDEDAPIEPAAPPVESLLSMGTPDVELQRGMDEAAADDLDEEGGDLDGEFSVGAVARHLVDNEINVAISVSPTGDNGSTAIVTLARAVAELDRRTILIDMTGSALPTRLMADSPMLPGITDLLTGEAAFAETIHGDRLSDAHIMPHGTADAQRAMRGADRLSMIIDALASAYDLVLVECGPADTAAVGRLARKGVEIILSAADAPAEQIETTAGAFIEAGYDDVVLLMGRGHGTPPLSSRRAA